MYRFKVTLGAGKEMENLPIKPHITVAVCAWSTTRDKFNKHIGESTVVPLFEHW